MKDNTIAIVQARMDSSRFPDKSLQKIGEWSLIELVMTRVNLATRVDQVVLATSTNPKDDVLESHVKELGFLVFRGSEDDVLSRFYDAVTTLKPTIVVRITGDCPLISPTLIDLAIERFTKAKVDYLTLSIGEDKTLAYPRGLDVEIASFESITKAAENASEQYEREHVMPYLYTHPEMFSVEYIDPPSELSRPRYRLCVDTTQDFDFLMHLYNHFGKDLIEVDIREIIGFLDNNSEIVGINQTVEQKHFKEVDERTK